MTYLTDAALGRVLTDLDHLVAPAQETVRAMAEECRENRRRLADLTHAHNALGIAAAEAERILHAANLEAAK